MNDDDPVQVYEAGNSTEAHLMVQMLADLGVQARVASSAVENVVGEVPFQRAVCPIWVHPNESERAREAILAFLANRSDDDSAEAIFCYHCGAPLNERLERCPHCQASLDWSS